MSKRTKILLIVVLVSSIVVAGHAEVNAVNKQNTISAYVLEPLSVAGLLYSGTSEGNRLPVFPDIMISDFFNDGTSQAYWVQSNQYRKQSRGFARNGHGGIALGVSHDCGCMQQFQSKSVTPVSSSESLSLFSPPGFTLRL